MSNNEPVQACDLVIFGTKGDLTRRKLLPSLYRLEKSRSLHAESTITGVGRADWDRKTYVGFVREALNAFLKEEMDEEVWSRFAERLDFCPLDVNDAEGFSALKEKVDQEKRITINYFAMPPATFSAICEGLASASLHLPPTRIVMEKPLGNSLETFREINDVVNRYFDESQVYRIDHYLGKETVLNLLALRFSNSLFLNNWDNRSIEHVQITVAEEVGIEGRWGYFDRAGQMRDMVQSHLLQILTMVTMSPPPDLSARAIRDEKVKLLRSLRRIDRSNIRDKVVRGQYTGGLINDQKVPGYPEEEGADKKSQTETFVSVRVDIDNWRWAGVPFYLRTGKRMPVKMSEIVIYFKKPQLNLFSASHKELPQNKLTIRLQPDEGMDLEILNKIPGLDHKHHLQITKLDLSYSDTFAEPKLADAYDRLLLECMRGIQALFLSRDEVEAAWEWVDSITHTWDTNNTPLRPYQAGTWGPLASVENISREGHEWNEFS
ncbi:MAG: glucose-6-phosphate dehydrogenase [Mixta calida]|nr:glucose-6-phosphate dehydrogenase [Mixta calida]